MADNERNNYVSPCGDFYVGTKHRYFGNRGAIHKDGRVVRDWSDKRWLVCVTTDLGPPETFMAPGHHTELFFLDEAVALAAGQRPCFRCRPAESKAYMSRFELTHPLARPKAPAMDAILHADRLDDSGRRRLHEVTVTDLPDGVFLLIDGEPWLLFEDAIHQWGPNGYAQKADVPSGNVQVLTPRCTVDVIRAGYRPDIDPSASGR